MANRIGTAERSQLAGVATSPLAFLGSDLGLRSPAGQRARQADGFEPAASTRAAQVAPALTSHPTLRKGAKGTAVKQLQQLLAAAGDSPGSIDGSFGPGTERALKRFQAANHLTADGVCGPKTWAALESSYQPPPPPPVSHPVLKKGAKGSEVTQLQNLLQDAGMEVSADGQFGSGTQLAVESYQYSRGLKVDGVAGASVWNALLSAKAPVDHTPSPANAALRQKLLSVAASQIGTIEATNHNDGAILKYPGLFGRKSESWCADFVSWVNTKSGNSLNYAYCPYLKNHLKAEGLWKGKSDPMPGDIIIFDENHDGVADHTGFVESVNKDGSINTIEGNTLNTQNGEEGVWRQTRSMDLIVGFGSPA
jgi:peptidoglycan hydrolase-like protein with peptidoglycan-binding domain